MNDNIPELKIACMADCTGDGLILLEQDSGGNLDRVADQLRREPNDHGTDKARIDDAKVSPGESAD